MKEKLEHRRQSSISMASWVLLVFLVLAVLYYLSVGPVYVLMWRGHLTIEQYEAAYWPLFQLISWSDFLTGVTEQYQLWWMLITDTGMPLGSVTFSG